MSNFDLNKLVRPNILQLKPYSSARSEFKGTAEVFLDANENPFDTGFNRYPDPLQWKLKAQIADFKDVATKNIFLGNGSDEAIDLLIRIFCEPGADHIITLPPTYGMYQVSADIANVEVREVQLKADFQPDINHILASANKNSKILFICSPNNPTGNNIHLDNIRALAAGFPGIVVVDEAYIDFSTQPSGITLLSEFPNVVVLQTFSKAWGLAGIRLGMAFAAKEIIHYFNKVKPPYNINQLTQTAALEALQNKAQQAQMVRTVIGQRALLQQYLMGLEYVQRIYPSDANFLLVKMDDPKGAYRYLVEKGIIVRDRSNVALCAGCLRITVGTPEENEQLMQALVEFVPSRKM
ncbi:MAG TPA: histidinol-phosphate transaminase [Saprospiraceae bacterium]|nr:histidinol-phosphate transaminase [Saprospiraceae bacterium]HMP24831.1 histidinol-phosphate transaminase [Saprospiraceae bacterium]